MLVYLLILVMSVFLGTRLIAIPTPVAQLTIYRVCALLVVPILLVQLKQQQQRLKWLARSHASYMVAILIGWWFWALASIAWAQQLKLWFQALFLMTLGLSAILALYFWVNRMQDWQRLMRGAWYVMTGLVIWGYSEIITGKYLFADLVKLDKGRTFTSNIWSRIPITTFANQNDYAVMLIAYITTCLVLYHFARTAVGRVTYLIWSVFALYLVYRTGSRMALACTFLLLMLIGLQQLTYYLTRTQLWRGFFAGGLVVIGLLWWKPVLLNKLAGLVQTVAHQYLSGDAVRVNLMRNGLLFLTETAGFGVGAGNIEHWMEQYAFLPTKDITNMHNWWFELLVGYGVIVFVAYVLGYAGLVYRLVQIKRIKVKTTQHIARVLWAYLIVFIPASMTSANNMLIEWHWVFLGLIISFIKIQEQQKERISS